MAWVATAIVGSAVVGGLSQAYSASKAADAQIAAGNQAIGFQKDQLAQTRSDLAPYRDLGTKYATQLDARMPELTSDISVDPNQLENSDYYKFASTQGQRAVTNSAAARGLATSGAALKGAASFAKGLATDTYKTAFDMENTNRTNAYSRLKGLIDTGANAAALGGQLGANAATNMGSAAVGIGNAQAGADIRTGSAIANTANGIGEYAKYQGLYGQATAPRPGSPSGPAPFS